MKTIYETSQFRKDIKKLKKQGKEIEKLKIIIRHIAVGVGGHFKMHHLWSLQSAPLWTG